jgi:hypothetical protein
MNDTVATVQSPFTLQTQTQTWPGADWWEAQVTLPPMPRSQAAAWIAWLAQLRGKQCVFLLGDSSATSPQGSPRGVPVIDGTVSSGNAVSSTVLYTKGWAATAHRLLLPGDYLQVGNRIYMCLDNVTSDVSGKAAINVWPSIREIPSDETAINLRNPTGLFRLADNARQWNFDVAQLFGLSFRCTEVR